MFPISQVIRKVNSRCALIPFITAGYPNLQTTKEALLMLDHNGADVIELGIPYADALADGPIIQESSRVALGQGVYTDQILNMVKSVYNRLNSPIVIFTYYNPILAQGIVNFVTKVSASGAKGLIIPDLPLEEADYMIELCKNYKIELILFISPTSSEARIESIISKSLGCIYLVSRTGVTGLSNEISNQVDQLAIKIKQKTDKLIILGFGISNVNHAKDVSEWKIDGIVIGSAFVKLISECNKDMGLEKISSFCKQVKKVIT
uniref:Tryptophan synthase alpha chain n=1 Tax=Asparagopsis taxiformis TaxID=260499 RepID=A0A1C9CC56_9FLOR|nr:tryptophan synthase alpha subunit [Asparagopsis taxiformis]AOM65970.1 tryptophan synthase alpha subunit [Asparagopsis taxiformis]